MSEKKALIQLNKKEASTKVKIEINVDRSLFKDINEYARFAKIPGRVLKDKRERLVIAMIEKILTDDVAYQEYKAEKEEDKKAIKAESKKLKKEIIEELVAADKEQEIEIKN